jgi:hypothetical protein
MRKSVIVKQVVCTHRTQMSSDIGVSRSDGKLYCTIISSTDLQTLDRQGESSQIREVFEPKYETSIIIKILAFTEHKCHLPPITISSTDLQTFDTELRLASSGRFLNPGTQEELITGMHPQNKKTAQPCLQLLTLTESRNND